MAATFIAFYVCLTVRIVNRRERWATQTLAAVVVVPVLYVASFGPACWVVSRTGIGIQAIPTIYLPVITRMNGAGTIETNVSIAFTPPRNTLQFYPSDAISRYAKLFAASGWCWRLYSESEAQPELAVSLREGQWEWCDGAAR
jgi:hypothetical protein